MGKNKAAKNKHQRRQATASARPATPAPSLPPGADEHTLARQIEEEAASARALAPDAIIEPSSPLRPDTVNLEDMWRMVSEVRERYQAAERRATEALLHATSQAEVVAEAQSQVEARRQEVDERARAASERQGMLDARERALLDRHAALLDKETALCGRELDAEAGFVSLRVRMLEELERAAATLRAEMAAGDRAIAQARAAWLAEERDARGRLQAELAAERAAHNDRLESERRTWMGQREERRLALEAEHEKRLQHLSQREDELEREARTLAHERRLLKWDQEEIQTERAALESRVEHRVAGIREEYEHRIHAVTAQLEQARRDRDRCEEMLRVREDADRRFGQRTPEEVLAELDALRATQAELQAALAERPDAGAAERLRALEAERAAWQSEQSDLRRRLAERERQLTLASVGGIELETLRDHKDALEASRSLLQRANAELRAEVDALVSRADGKSPFVRCQAMDSERELQSEVPLHEDIRDLKAFVADMQQRIAHDPEHPKRRLFYRLRDLRSFLGGLAMSRLILLQGISGTGKTSLPVAFARAMGTRAEIIEVQAGWRDPQDLIGHYNPFDKRFYEKELLTALYRAQTPRWRGGVHLVVLDEMNLSHPEQYFSDFLSALEQVPENQRLVLMPQPVTPAPACLRDGRLLPIPPNVWFVGTANHDETTKGFADKTYDRAHVMELPPRFEQFEIARPGERYPISFAALQAAFARAKERHADSAAKAIAFLENTVRVPLSRYFQIGWGVRLEHQIRAYVPVVVAAGGTVGEATDYLLAMRLLRKIGARHDIRRDHLERVRDNIDSAWRELDPRGKPEMVHAMLERELRRLGYEPEEAAV